MSDETNRLKDILSLVPELVDCQHMQEFDEIVLTLKELLFPETIGEIQIGSAGPKISSKHLNKRMQFVGSQVSSIRQEKFWTVKDLSRKSNLPLDCLKKIEAGQHSPSDKALKKIARALDVSVGKLDPSYDCI